MFSQNGFFIRPSVYSKVSISNGNPSREIDCADGSKIFYYSRYNSSMPDITKKLFGLTLGYYFQQFAFEIGLLSEVSRFTGRVKYLTSSVGSTPGSYNYYLASQSKSLGTSNLRFPFRVYYGIHPGSGKVSINNIYFFAGLDLLTPSFSAWRSESVWNLSSKTITTPYSGEVITYEFGVKRSNIVTIAPSIGFMIKLKYKSKFEICNLHLDWHFDGVKALGNHKAVFTNSNGDTYELYNRLSAQGVILKISRDFNSRPRLIHKKT